MLNTTNLVGFGGRQAGAGIVPLTATYLTSADSAGEPIESASFTSQTLGTEPTASQRRYIFVCAVTNDEADESGNQITSITIAGTAATLVTSSASDGVLGTEEVFIRWGYREVSSGTTGTIAISVTSPGYEPGNIGYHSYAVYSDLNGINSTIGTAEDANAISYSITGTVNGVVLVGANSSDTLAGIGPLGGDVTEDVEHQLGSWASSAASLEVTSTGSKSITWTSSPTNSSISQALAINLP